MAGESKVRPGDAELLERAHRHSIDHREELHASELCGCFYCGRTFPPGRIKEWVDQGQTARCPECSIDSVIGDRAGFPISDEFLRRMKRYWF